MAKHFNPAALVSNKTNMSTIAPAAKTTANMEFLIRRVARDQRRARRAI